MAYMWNLKKNYKNKCIYKTEIDSQTQKTNLRLQKGRGGQEGPIRSMGLTDRKYHT